MRCELKSMFDKTFSKTTDFKVNRTIFPTEAESKIISEMVGDVINSHNKA